MPTDSLRRGFNSQGPSSPGAGVSDSNINFTESEEDQYVNINFYPPNLIYNIAEKPWLPKPHTPYVLVNAKLVDPRRSKVLKNMTIHLAKGRVQSMAPTAPTNIDGDFRYGGVKAQED
jgi:hypothetical protein